MKGCNDPLSCDTMTQSLRDVITSHYQLIKGTTCLESKLNQLYNQELPVTQPPRYVSSSHTLVYK